VTEVGGVPEIVGAAGGGGDPLGGLDTVMVNAGREAERIPSLTLMRMLL